MPARKKKKTGILKSIFWLMILVIGFTGIVWANWEKIPKKYRNQFARNTVVLRAQLEEINWRDYKLPDFEIPDFELPSFDFFKKEKPKPQFRPLPPKPSSQGDVPLPGETLHYVRVGSCLFAECTGNYKNLLKDMGMNAKVILKQQKSRFYDVVSADYFLPSLIEQKLAIVKRYNMTHFRPFIEKKGKNQIISFGSFPQKEKADKLERYLAQLYTDTNVRFQVTGVSKKYQVTKIYAGPFTSQENAQAAHRRLRRKAGLKDSFVTNQL